MQNTLYDDILCHSDTSLCKLMWLYRLMEKGKYMEQKASGCHKSNRKLAIHRRQNLRLFAFVLFYLIILHLLILKDFLT